jgi:putative ABC transport system permease protein
MFAIAIRTMRNRWVGFAGAFIATTLAVVLVSAWGILMQSAIQSKAKPVRYANAPVVVANKQTVAGSDPLVERNRLPVRLVDELQGIKQVRAAVPDVSFPATLQDKVVTAYGWSSTELTKTHLRAGHKPGNGQIAVGSQYGMRVGEQVTLHTPTGDKSLTVSGITGGSGVFVLNASQLAGAPGKVDAIGVFGKPGVSAVQLAQAIKKTAGSAAVLTGDDRGRPEFPDMVQAGADLESLAGAIGGIAIMVAIFVVAGTLAVSVQQRSREVALLRAVAATPRQIRRMIAGEGLIIGLAAAIAGIGPGILLAEILHSLLIDKGIISAHIRLHIGWVPFLVAGAGGLLVVELAGIVAGRRAGRTKPTAALAESTVQPKRIGIFRLLLGLGALGGGITLLTQSLSMQGDDAAGAAAGIVMILMTAVGLLGPIIAWIGSLLLGSPMRALSTIGGFLAAVNARARTRRLASAISPVALTVALAFLTVFLQGMLRHASDQQSRKRIVADRVITAPAQGIPASSVAKMQQVSGVDSAVGILPTQIEHGGVDDMTSYDAVAVTGGAINKVLDLDVTGGHLRNLGPGQIALSNDAAHAMHAKIGDQVRFRLGDGAPAGARLVATYDRALGFGDAVLPWSAAAGHVNTLAAPTALVRFDPGADPTKAVQAADPQAHIAGRTAYQAQQERDEEINAWANYLLLGVIGGYAAVAVANTLVMTMIERRREFALMRLIGATTGQVQRMVRWEAGLVALLGVGIGSAIGYVTLIPFSRALGPDVSPYVPPLPYVVIAGGAALLALVASVLPARRALASHPVDAAGIRE